MFKFPTQKISKVGTHFVPLFQNTSFLKQFYWWRRRTYSHANGTNVHKSVAAGVLNHRSWKTDIANSFSRHIFVLFVKWSWKLRLLNVILVASAYQLLRKKLCLGGSLVASSILLLTVCSTKLLLSIFYNHKLYSDTGIYVFSSLDE